jgi:two-component system response regulator PilR (NtrC family)
MSDLPEIVEFMLQKLEKSRKSRVRRVSPEVMAVLMRHRWPGNVRELENVVERAVALETSDHIRTETLGEHLRDGRPATSMSGKRGDEALPAAGFNLEQHLQEIERTHIERALKQAGGVQVRAADLLGLSFRQLRYLVKKYQLR